MSLSDPIADMLTRIRNASRVRREHVSVKASKVCQGVISDRKCRQDNVGGELICTVS